jgi:phage baseplate assembly protein W
MSFDAQLAHACPHFIRYERTSISGGREILPLSPISGSGMLKLRVDEVEIPPEGLFSLVSAPFPSSAPYKITATSNTLFIASESTEVEIILPAKIYSQAEMISQISKSLPPPFSVSAYGQSVAVENGGQTNKLTLSGSALARLGFKGARLTKRAKTLAPSWKLVKDRTRPGSKIIFSDTYEPQGLVDISYLAEKSYCRRCGGTGVENDFRFDVSGDIQVIEGYDLLYQAVAKILLTQYRSNPYHTWYGSTAISLIGKKSNSGTALALKDSVRAALDNLVNIQGQQVKVQAMSLEERLKRVVSIDVTSLGDDQTAYLVKVVVESMSSQPVSINIVFAVPGSIPLDGGLV